MPLGILDDDEFEKEISNFKDKAVTKTNDDVIYKEIPTSGRNKGDTNKPETLRKVIAECKINGSSNSEIMDVFKTSESSIHAYENGRNGTSSKVDARLAKFVKSARTSITRKASRKLIATLDKITDEKLDELKGNELSVTAKNLSSIINDMETKNSHIGNQLNAQFVIFAPPQKKISDYDIIEVNS